MKKQKIDVMGTEISIISVDIFGMWISAEFKIYLIKEFKRLKKEETNRLKLEWSLQRTISKINYRIHTDAIKGNLIPPELSKNQIQMVMQVRPIFSMFRCSG